MGPVDLDMSGKPRTRQNSSSSPSQSLTVTVTSSLTLFGIDFRVGPTTVPNRDSPSVPESELLHCGFTGKSDPPPP
jgi:hypothetical protein